MITARLLEGFTTQLDDGRGHLVTADEPTDIGGADQGPRPTELLAMSLASCTAITMQMYAQRKQMDIHGLEVAVDYETDSRAGKASYEVVLRMPPGLGDDQRERLEKIATKCPVHRLLKGDVEITQRSEPAKE